MKKLIIAVIVTVLWASFSAIGIQAQKKKVDNRDILDYYNLMAGNVLGHDKENSRLNLLSKKQGYMEVRLSDPVRWAFIALFRKGDGSALLMVSHQEFCSSQEGCGHYLQAFEFDEFDSAISVDEQVIPKLSKREDLAIFNSKLPKGSDRAYEVNLKYKLPLNGTVIKVVGIEFDEGDNGRALELYELHLKDDRFVIVR